jgi:hypothetical protein
LWWDDLVGCGEYFSELKTTLGGLHATFDKAIKVGVFRLGFAKSEGNPSSCGGFVCGFGGTIYGNFENYEAGCLQKVSVSNSKLGRKGNRELKRLECPISFDSKFES